MNGKQREKALEIDGLSYGYRGNWSLARVPSLMPFSLDVFAGEAFGFLGHNGAGKTTTIKCLLNLIRPSSGQVKIFGRDSRDAQSRSAVGYLPEQPYFYDNLTVAEIMAMYARLAGLPAGDTKRAIAAALDAVKIGARAKSNMRTLSKGLMQRVALAQALLNNPRLLILDEPFSGLDPIGRKEFREIFFDLKSRGVTMFMSSHILGDVEFLCDRVSILAHGRLKGVFDLADVPRFAGSHYELVVRDFAAVEADLKALATRSEQQDKILLLEFDDRHKSMAALRLAMDRGASVESYEFAQGSLEDLFVKLVQFDEGGGRP